MNEKPGELPINNTPTHLHCLRMERRHTIANIKLALDTPRVRQFRSIANTTNGAYISQSTRPLVSNSSSVSRPAVQFTPCRSMPFQSSSLLGHKLATESAGSSHSATKDRPLPTCQKHASTITLLYTVALGTTFNTIITIIVIIAAHLVAGVNDSLGLIVRH
jgi:hypothetical protein